jgi:chromosomal replication initiator protein
MVHGPYGSRVHILGKASDQDSHDDDFLSVAMNIPQLRERTLTQMQDAVAHMFGLAVHELSKESGPRVVALPRHIAMYLSKQLTDASVSEIGRHFGGRQHASVRYSIAKIHELRATDAGVNKAIETLLEKLTS